MKGWIMCPITGDVFIMVENVAGEHHYPQCSARKKPLFQKQHKKAYYSCRKHSGIKSLMFCCLKLKLKSSGLHRKFVGGANRCVEEGGLQPDSVTLVLSGGMGQNSSKLL
ncbi:hypothetical protein AMECASPLE_031013 [Ameca splendens]|uniref:Uncharacterized protein n=1 Tax=Ameca splendens TaxID=208324 RepID=A0ABV0ZR10_9TELE